MQIESEFHVPIFHSFREIRYQRAWRPGHLTHLTSHMTWVGSPSRALGLRPFTRNDFFSYYIQNKKKTVVNFFFSICSSKKKMTRKYLDRLRIYTCLVMWASWKLEGKVLVGRSTVVIGFDVIRSTWERKDQTKKLFGHRKLQRNFLPKITRSN